MDEIQALADAAHADINARTKQVREEMDRLEADEKTWVSENNFVPLSWKGKVKLDIGGKKFFTTLAVLGSKEGFFQAITAGAGRVEKDNEGCLFIDRSPCVFRYILNYLSDHPIPFNDLSEREKDMLVIESEFYELEDLKRLCSNKIPETVTEVKDATAKTATPAEPPSDELTAMRNLLSKCKDVENEISEKRRVFEKKKLMYERLVAKILSVTSMEKIRLQLQEESQVFCTTLKTLRSRPGMLQGKFARKEMWEGDIDQDDGSVFVNKDGSTFDMVLGLLRGYPVPEHLTAIETNSFAADLEYFSLDKTLSYWYRSAIVTALSYEMEDDVFTIMKDWFGAFSKGKLFYKRSASTSSKGSWSAGCYRKPTVVLIRDSEGNVFGGYNSVPWGQAGTPDPNSFFFSLKNLKQILPQKYAPKGTGDGGKGEGIIRWLSTELNFGGIFIYRDRVKFGSDIGYPIPADVFPSSELNIAELEIFEMLPLQE
jgi:hypothetical protein